jgi:hypothetical protein
MGRLGFSYIGAVWLAMLLVPNLLWARHMPQGCTAQGENRALVLLERLGQAAVTCCALVFTDFNLRPWSPWSLWLAGSLLLLLLYELWWLRYLRSPRQPEDLYRSLLGVPLPGAVLPVAAFLLLGLYGRVLWMLLAAALLGVGHIGVHWGHRQTLRAHKNTPGQNRP